MEHSTQQNLKKRKSSGCIGCLLVSFVVTFIFLVSFPIYVKITEIRHIRIEGKVVDDTTGEPASRARVVASARPWSLKGGVVNHFGVAADNFGRFKIDTETPLPVRSLTVEASGPGNLYAKIDRLDFNNTSEIVLQLSPLSEKFRGKSGLRYEGFYGEMLPRLRAPRPNFTFLGESWEIRTDEQIRRGVPPPQVRPVDPEMEKARRE